MKKPYEHLSREERAVIQIQRAHNPKVTLRQIGRTLGRCHTTIGRELRRAAAFDQSTQSGERSSPGCAVAVIGVAGYDATRATAGCQQRRRSCGRKRKLVEGTALYLHVHDKLVYQRWSPQQIAAALKAMHPTDPTQTVSHETIYATIYAWPRGSLKQGMIEVLRQRKSRRGVRRRTLAGGPVQVAEAQRIEHRPEEVGRRQVPGHWEGDFIKGAFNRSGVGTLVERKTRFVILCKMDGCTAEAALEGFTRQMRKLPAFLRESLTYDRGSEMARHEELATRLNIDIWFADPHAPWQRGSNENTNGLLRQFMPKGTDLSGLSQTHLNDIARLMNDRPRQTLGWKTPAQILAQEIQNFKQNGALGG